MIEHLRNMFSVPDLRKRILFTLAMLGVYRLGSQIPTPGVNYIALKEFVAKDQGLLSFLNMFSGGALEKCSIFALGIMPYISASIMFQLLTILWPYLERLQKEGGVEGRRKINQWTRYSTLAVALVQGLGILKFLYSLQGEGGGGAGQILINPGISFSLMALLLIITGTCFVMWLGEQITARGIGNGISLMIFAGIVAGLGPAIGGTWTNLRDNQISFVALVFLCAFMVLVVAGVVHVERAVRKIPVQYARRMVGMRMMGGQGAYFPLKLNPSGVMPVIFASSVLLIPGILLDLDALKDIAWLKPLKESFGFDGGLLYILLYIVGIIFFAYFYTSIVFNPSDLADNLKKNGGFIPGIRPGKRTAEYIDTILSRLIFAGAIYLSVLALVPILVLSGIKLDQLPFVGGPLKVFLEKASLGWILRGFNVSFYFGGTSLLIVVGVAMDFVQQVESQLVMRHYEGFLSRGRSRRRS